MRKDEYTRRRFVGHVLGAGIGTTLAPAVLAASTARPTRFGEVGARHGRPADGFVLCVFSKHLQFLEFDELAEVAAAIGFDGVDLTVRPGGHVEPDAVERDLPAAVGAIRAAGLQVPMITTDVTSIEQSHARVVLETAAQVGIPGYRTGYLHYEGGQRVVETLERLRPQMEALAVLNEELGIQGAYQNHDGQYVGAPLWDLALLFEDLDPAWLGIQYDVRHATVEGAHSWPMALDLLAPRVHSLVVKDFRWQSTEAGSAIEDTPLGKGTVDFSAFWQLVKTHNLRRPISLHFEYPMPGSTEPLSAEVLRARTMEVMQRDLAVLRKMLVQAGMG